MFMVDVPSSTTISPWSFYFSWLPRASRTVKRFGSVARFPRDSLGNRVSKIWPCKFPFSRGPKAQACERHFEWIYITWESHEGENFLRTLSRHDFPLVFGVDIQTTLSKADRLLYGESAMTHAMVFTGISTNVSATSYSDDFKYIKIFTSSDTKFSIY